MASSVGTGSTVFLFLLRMVKEEEEEGLPRVNASETSRSSSAVSAHWRSRTDPTRS
jgi:ribose 5-phosphate isomerase